MDNKELDEGWIIFLGGPLLWLFLLIYGLYVQAFAELLGRR